MVISKEKKKEKIKLIKNQKLLDLSKKTKMPIEELIKKIEDIY